MGHVVNHHYHDRSHLYMIVYCSSFYDQQTYSKRVKTTVIDTYTGYDIRY